MIENIPETFNLRLNNSPKNHEPGKRTIGFVVDNDEFELGLGHFSPLLEKYCTLFLVAQGYKVEKKAVNDRLTTEDRM